VYAGLRPLIDPNVGNGGKPTTKLSREHVVDVPVPGLASIAGGKFTTYRLMARDVIDAAVADFDRLGREVPGSVTDQVPLLGADGLAAVQAATSRLAEDYGVPREAVEHLLGRYGTLAEEVLGLVRGDSALGRPLAEGHPYLRAEVTYAVTHENALHVEDVLMRRTRLFIEAADGGAGAAADVALLMGKLLGWSRRRRAGETRRYLELLEAERVVPSAAAAPAAPVAAEPVLGALAAAR
jgi:glycerol-3-phosphate dehydrogenase